MGKAKKSVKKFKESGGLQRKIDQRRIEKKRRAKEESVKSAPAPAGSKQDAPNPDDWVDGKESKPVKAAKEQAANIENLDVDSFLDGDFLLQSDDEQKDAEDGEDDEANEGDAADGEEDSDEEFDFEQHQKDLEALKLKDPEFYAHLQQHGKDLLDFQPVNVPKPELGGNDDAEDDAGAEDRSSKRRNIASYSADELRAMQQRVLRDRSVTALKHFLTLFRSACHLNDEAAAGEVDKRDAAQIGFAGSAAYNNFMIFAFKHVPAVLMHHLGPAEQVEDKETTTVSVKKRAGWSRFADYVRSYLTNAIYFLQHLAGVQVDSDGKSATSSVSASNTMTRFVLSRLHFMMPFFEPFPKVAQKTLKILLHVWSTAEQHTRIDAFLRVRDLALVMPPQSELLEMILKGVYLTYVRSTAHVSRHTLPTIMFMANCVVEAYSLEPIAAYQHAFVYIRQLAIHLRNAIIAKTPEAYHGVYNWQYVNCLRVWSMVLAAQGRQGQPLAPLVYPFIQICIGVMELLPIVRFFPLRFAVCRYLNLLCKHTQVYVPLASHLISVLACAELQRKARPSSAKPFDLATALKAPKSSTDTKVYQEMVVSAMLRLLLQHFAIFSHSLAFPELIIPPRALLKSFGKQTKVLRIRKQINELVSKLDANAEYVSRRRLKLGVSPKDVDLNQGSGSVAVNDGDSAQSPLERYLQLSTTAKDDEETWADAFGLNGKAAQNESAQKTAAPAAASAQSRKSGKAAPQEEDEDEDDVDDEADEGSDDDDDIDADEIGGDDDEGDDMGDEFSDEAGSDDYGDFVQEFDDDSEDEPAPKGKVKGKAQNKANGKDSGKAAAAAPTKAGSKASKAAKKKASALAALTAAANSGDAMADDDVDVLQLSDSD